MSTFLSDTFTGSDGTDLSAHAGETGATWTKHGSVSGGALVISNNRIRGTVNDAEVLYYASGTPATADYTVTAVVNLVSQVAEANQAVAVAGRTDTAAKTFYVFFVQAFNSLCTLGKYVAGTFTVLATSPQTFAADTDYTIALEMVGTAIKGYLNGVAVCSVTDAAIATAGRAGVWAYDQTSPTSDLHICSVSAADAAGGAPAAPSSLAVASVTSSTVNLTFDNNATDADELELQYLDDVNYTDNFNDTGDGWAGSAMPISVSLAPDATATGVVDLAAGTVYHFRIRASNASGDSDWSNLASATTATTLNYSPNAARYPLGRHITLTCATGLAVGTAITAQLKATGAPGSEGGGAGTVAADGSITIAVTIPNNQTLVDEDAAGGTHFFRLITTDDDGGTLTVSGAAFTIVAGAGGAPPCIGRGGVAFGRVGRRRFAN
jgi:hypothetical protein